MSDPYRQIGRITFGPASSTGEQQGAYATCVTAAGVAAAARTVGTLEAENARLREELAAMRDELREAREIIYSLDARGIYDEELAAIDAALAKGSP